MLNNNELYHFDPESNSTKPEIEMTPPEDLKFNFPIKLLYQIIISSCCLICLLVISHGKIPCLQWVNQRIHSAINASMADTFGRISKSVLLQTIINHAGNLVRLEEITKNISSPEFSIKNIEKRIFQNSVWPVQGSITKGYGWRYDPTDKIKKFSSGIEITAVPDATVLAIADGTITEIKHQPQNGWEIIISHGDGWKSAYNYLGKVNAKMGQIVKAGDPIAQIGRPDQEKGPVLLLEIKEYDQPIDPLSVLVS